ncbi:MAG: hypothetical protein C4519_23740 [Desulfobacteraceae bacterium]|nr:MAG: hypothetical protein C4519_23740 [Desulfobacteraceae bacterium]
MEKEKSAAIPDKDWETRILCSDESCIGVIGPDGRCKECGLEYKGPLPIPSEIAQYTDTFEAPDADEETDDPAGDSETRVDDPEWEQRKLCRDETCIGVIGPDGRCKECGRPYEE